MDMGRGVEVEDDLFFADLSKRISLLIMEEEEEFPRNYPDVSIQGYNHAPHPFFAPPPFVYEAATYRSSTKGTGVFFPRLSLPKKQKNRPGRSRVQGEKAARAAASIIHHHPATTKKHTQT